MYRHRLNFLGEAVLQVQSKKLVNSVVWVDVEYVKLLWRDAVPEDGLFIFGPNSHFFHRATIFNQLVLQRRKSHGQNCGGVVYHNIPKEVWQGVVPDRFKFEQSNPNPTKNVEVEYDKETDTFSATATHINNISSCGVSEKAALFALIDALTLYFDTLGDYHVD